jgi:hypothetical protein
MKCRAMADPDRVREAGWVLRPRRRNRLIKRVSQEVIAGLWLNGDIPIPVLSFQFATKPIGVDSLGAFNDRFRFG